jgi:transposase
MEKENTVIRSKKIKLLPTSLQKKQLTKWNHHHRYTYNKTISIMNDDDDNIEPAFKNYYKTYGNEKNENYYVRRTHTIFYNKLELRNMITPVDKCSRIKWILETPKSIRESAVFEAHKNLTSAFTNLCNGHIKKFNLRFKNRRSISWSYRISHDSLKAYGKYIGIYEMSSGMKIKSTESINEINHDSEIYYDGLNYYIIIPYTKTINRNDCKNWFCASDPGNRKFQVIYSPDEDEHIIIGNRCSSKMYDYLLYLDYLLSKKCNVRNEKKSKLIKKLRIKINNMQKELHYKLANYMCKNYENIYISKLTKGNDIINKKNRIINKSVVRKMVVLGHCKFIERLKTKAEEYTKTKLHIITEEYTSQECLSCRQRTKTKNETYKCIFCNYTIDRDILGSVNILLKNL